MIKIIENKPATKFVAPNEIKIGQVGIIRKWMNKKYIGRIVVKTPCSTLIEADFSQLCESSYWATTDAQTDINFFAVELLPAGTKLEITLGQNE